MPLTASTSILSVPFQPAAHVIPWGGYIGGQMESMRGGLRSKMYLDGLNRHRSRAIPASRACHSVGRVYRRANGIYAWRFKKQNVFGRPQQA